MNETPIGSLPNVTADARLAFSLGAAVPQPPVLQALVVAARKR